jgi:hypothetical protein
VRSPKAGDASVGGTAAAPFCAKARELTASATTSETATALHDGPDDPSRNVDIGATSASRYSFSMTRSTTSVSSPRAPSSENAWSANTAVTTTLPAPGAITGAAASASPG